MQIARANAFLRTTFRRHQNLWLFGASVLGAFGGRRGYWQLKYLIKTCLIIFVVLWYIVQISMGGIVVLVKGGSLVYDYGRSTHCIMREIIPHISIYLCICVLLSASNWKRQYIKYTHFAQWLLHVPLHIDGLVQDCSNPSASTMELLQFWTKPSTWFPVVCIPNDLALKVLNWTY